MQVAAVHVTGPRYWHQQLLATQGSKGQGRGPSLAALYATRTLFVQRKAGALPYADDPSGAPAALYGPTAMRGATSASLAQPRVDACLSPLHQHTLPATPSTHAGVRSLLSGMVHHGGGASPADDSFDLVNLCSTFGSDPAVMSFAQVGA